jgi:hypothetical protein
MKIKINSFINSFHNARAALIALGILALGLILLPFHEIPYLHELGQALLITGVVAIWEMYAHRLFFYQIVNDYNLSADIESAGIQQITFAPYSDISWDDILNRATSLEMVFIRGFGWTHIVDLTKFFEKPNTRATFYFPNYKNEETLKNCASRWGNQDPAETKKNIINQIKSLQHFDSSGTRLKIKLSNYIPYILLCRTDNTAVLIISRYDKTIQLPTLVCKKDKELYKYVLHQLKFVKDAAVDYE